MDDHLPLLGLLHDACALVLAHGPLVTGEVHSSQAGMGLALPGMDRMTTEGELRKRSVEWCRFGAPIVMYNSPIGIVYNMCLHHVHILNFIHHYRCYSRYCDIPCNHVIIYDHRQLYV